MLRFDRLNAMQHFVLILLHRPFYTRHNSSTNLPINDTAIRRCNASATRIVALFEVRSPSRSSLISTLERTLLTLRALSPLAAVSAQPRAPLRPHLGHPDRLFRRDDAPPRPRQRRERQPAEAGGRAARDDNGVRPHLARDGQGVRVRARDGRHLRGPRREVGRPAAVGRRR